MASVLVPDADSTSVTEGARKMDVDSTTPSDNEKVADAPKKYPWRFWAIFVSLSVTGLLAALEGTVTSTALPTISEDLNAGELYIWFINAYFLTR